MKSCIQRRSGAIGRGRKNSSQNEKSFVEDTAATTGKGRSTVAREVTRANKVTVLRDIAGTSLDNGDEIDALATLPEEKQKELAIAARQGGRVSAKVEAKRERRAMLERELGHRQKALPQKKYGVILAIRNGSMCRGHRQAWIVRPTITIPPVRPR
jgi:hypothetical protein